MGALIQIAFFIFLTQLGQNQAILFSLFLKNSGLEKLLEISWPLKSSFFYFFFYFFLLLRLINRSFVIDRLCIMKDCSRVYHHFISLWDAAPSSLNDIKSHFDQRQGKYRVFLKASWFRKNLLVSWILRKNERTNEKMHCRSYMVKT